MPLSLDGGRQSQTKETLQNEKVITTPNISDDGNPRWTGTGW